MARRILGILQGMHRNPLLRRNFQHDSERGVPAPIILTQTCPAQDGIPERAAGSRQRERTPRTAQGAGEACGQLGDRSRSSLRNRNGEPVLLPGRAVLPALQEKAQQRGIRTRSTARGLLGAFNIPTPELRGVLQEHLPRASKEEGVRGDLGRGIPKENSKKPRSAAEMVDRQDPKNLLDRAEGQLV